MINKEKWTYNENPGLPGWYPVLKCYDVQEGIFPAASYFDEKEWDQRYIVAFIDRAQENETSARELAYLNDPDI